MTMIKLAFMDESTKEYYVREDYGIFKFSDNPEKAKLYFKSSALEETFEYVSHNSKRELILVEMEVIVSYQQQSTYFDDLKEKRRSEFERLNIEADRDIDGMDETLYKRWRTLKREFGEVKNDLVS